ncbi:MAG: PAS domain-containing protein [Rhodospirillales bacterium]|nr:PAS domain-containing protein [Alphaproteobacteria bacterium]USO04223.1 MAG: PAS domain-containing protein [Rhodospirillales bacterium]
MASVKKIQKKQTSQKAPALKTDAASPRLIADTQGCILYANSAFEKLCGETSLKGKALDKVITFEHPEDVFRASALFGDKQEGAFDSLRSGLHLLSFPGKKSKENHKDAKSTRMQFDRVETVDGRCFLIASAQEQTSSLSENILELINYKPRKTKSARIAQEMFPFLDMSDDIMSISDKDGVYLQTNEIFVRQLGYEDRDIEGKTFIDLVHPDDRAHVLASMQGLMHAEDTASDLLIDFEARIVTKSGSILWMNWRHKRVGGHIYSIGRDVTEIKKQEEALKRHERQLSEAETIGKMGHWRWQVGQDEIFWSDEVYRIFGTDPETFVPSLDNVNSMLHRRDAGRMIQAFQRAIIAQNDYDMDFEIRDPGGETRFVRCEGRCELDEDGDVAALYGIMQDITEAVLHERDLRTAKESAERAYASKTQFLANMSHELRTPLNAIIGFSEMIQRQLLGPIGTEKYLEYIAGIRESGEHLLDLISDILDMSKIEAGKYELDLEEIRLSKLIKLSIHMMEGRALENDIHIQAEIDNEDLLIVADRRGVMQILLNLLSNAVKFSKKGGKITVKAIEREKYLSLQVQDHGIGIPANKLKTITNPFEQAASHYTREHEGSGLGLAITKELVELHGGTLHIESTLGKGTTVTIRLPYDASQACRARMEAAKLSSAAAE